MNNEPRIMIYLCKEFDETFLLEAENDNDAIEKASLYNGVVIRRLTEYEFLTIDHEP